MNVDLSLIRPYAPLVRRIEAEATVIGDQILKIDHFLNHRIEPSFITEMGQELARRLAQFEPTVILTAEASGLAPGLVVAQALNVPLVYAKKYAPQVDSPAIARVIPSPTKGGETKLVLSQRYIVPTDRVVIVDDFLSNGRTAVALVEMAREQPCDETELLAINGVGYRKLERFGEPFLECIRDHCRGVS